MAREEDQEVLDHLVLQRAQDSKREVHSEVDKVV